MIRSSQSVGRCVGRLSNKIRRKVDSFSCKGQFSGAQGKVLHFLLAQSGDVFQKDVEEEFGMRPPTATELLKKMEENGLIRREAASYDARLKRILLTEKALQYREQVCKDLDGMEEEMMRGIREEDLEVFFRVMEQLIDNLS